MTLLHHPPSQQELERLYHELAQVGAPSVGRPSPWPYEVACPEELLALAGEMLRYDPRLLSILLELFLTRWDTLNPLTLRRAMHRMAWPQALLVVLDFAREASDDRELRYFSEYLAAGRARVSPAQRFFMEGERPGSRVARRRAGRSLTAYQKWGFIGNERPSTSATGKTRVGRYDADTRRRIRHALAERKDSFTMAEYLAALDHSVTRQRAYQDLQGDPGFEVVGHGRGARWRQRAGTDGAEAARLTPP